MYTGTDAVKGGVQWKSQHVSGQYVVEWSLDDQRWLARHEGRRWRIGLYSTLDAACTACERYQDDLEAETEAVPPRNLFDSIRGEKP